MSKAIGIPDGLVVRVLGAVEVERDGVAVDLPSRRRRALLAALAVRGRAVSVPELVDAVWDDDPPANARSTLQTYVSRLRRELGAESVLHGPAGYRLHAAVRVDATVARQLARDVSALGGGDDGDARRADLALAGLALWTGPTLAEFADSDWFTPARVELDGLRADLVDVAGDALCRAGRAPEAVATLERALATDPWREPTQILLVRSLLGAGRGTDAVRAAARYRRDLAEATGLVPGRAFDDVEAAALAGDESGDPSLAPATGHGLGTPPSAPASAPASASASAPRVLGPSDGLSPVPLSRPTPLVGRGDDLGRLADASDRARLVTVTGPGGIGKTRLVAEWLGDQLDVGDCVVVELAPVERGAVAATIGAALGVRAERADAAIVAERLHSARLALVLDNAEHVLDEVRSICRSVADNCPGVRTVVTSRERLDLPDEVVVAIDPLDASGPGSDAASLFVDRVRRARSRYELSIDDTAVATLCERLDGVPLAIELAASRASVLGVAALVRVLESDGLLGGVDGGRGRHATLGNVVAWSVDLLGGEARRLLAALSVFRGEFDLDAATTVGSAVVDEPVPLLLGRLVDTSLVNLRAAPGTYVLLDMVRAYAADLLTTDPSEADARRAHAAWVEGRLVAVGAMVPGGDESRVVAAVDALRHEVHTCVGWSLEHDEPMAATSVAAALAGVMLYRPDADLMGQIGRIAASPAVVGPCEGSAAAAGARVAFLSGDLDGVLPLAERALTAAGDDPRVARRAEHALGVVNLYRGRFDDSRAWFERALADERSSVTEQLDALGGLALARCYLGESGPAVASIEHMRGMLAAVESPTYRAFADYARAEVHLALGEIDEAAGLLADAAERAWSVGAAFVWGVASTVLASVLVRHRDPAEARTHLPVLVERWQRAAVWPQLWTTLRLAAEHLAAAGDPATARLVVAAAERDPAAPSLAGGDLARMTELCVRLDDELGSASAGVTAAAIAVDRATVLERALDALRRPLATDRVRHVPSQ